MEKSGTIRALYLAMALEVRTSVLYLQKIISSSDIILEDGSASLASIEWPGGEITLKLQRLFFVFPLRRQNNWTLRNFKRVRIRDGK